LNEIDKEVGRKRRKEMFGSKYIIVSNLVFVISLFLLIGVTPVSAQSTAFTYQGRLTDNNQPANGIYDFEFKLFDAVTGGTQDGTARQVLNVTVTNGVFTVLVDFGAGAFPGADRYLEIGVRPAGSPTFTTLTPRQQITVTPYALFSSSTGFADFATNATNAINSTNAENAETAQTATNAMTAQNSLQLGGVAANQYVRTNDARLSDARNPLPGSASYIQNTTAQQTTSNFNISGNGTAGGTLAANIVSATTQFNIGISRVLVSPGSFNFFAGNGAGQLNTSGTSNSFFGINAGIFNNTGSSNAFFGFEAGRNNQTGTNNAYFGKDAGRSSTTGNDNSFFGNDAGQSNTTGGSNSFFGKGAGADNTTATGNSYFGYLSGNSNTTGANNSFFGFEAGRLSDASFNNSFFGYEAGENNVIGLNNSFFGFNAGKLTTGSRNSFFGSGAGQVTTQAFHNSFFGGTAGGANTTGDDNSFFGLESGDTNTTGNSNTLFGAYTDVSTNNLTNATAIGARAFVGQSNALILGSVNGINGATANTDVGIGTTTPLNRLHVVGIIRVESLGAAGSTDLCRNTNNQISTCSSSLRYKTDISPFNPGLNLIASLRPIEFTWKEDGKRDLGLGAEDVEKVEPLLVTYNAKGEVEGVKYDRVAVVLVNALKEQQDLIIKQEELLRQQQGVLLDQKRKLDRQQQQLDALRKLVCQNNPRREACK
jgi:hypothetical protein